MRQHNSERIFFDSCMECDGLALCSGRWHPHVRSGSGVLAVTAVCLDCGEEYITNKQPEDVSGASLVWQRIMKTNIDGTPYSVSECGAIPNAPGSPGANNRQQ